MSEQVMKNKEVLQLPTITNGRFLGYLNVMTEDPLDMFRQAHEEFDGVARVRFGPIYAFLVDHPQYIKEILVERPGVFVKQTRGYKKLQLILGNGLVISEGSFWKKQRRIIQPAFQRKHFAAWMELFESYTDIFAAKWKLKAREGCIVDISDEMMALTLSIAGKAFFGSDVESEVAKIGESMEAALTRFNRLIASPFPFPEYLPTLRNFRFHRATKHIRDVVDGFIEQRLQEKSEKNDLLSLLLKAKDEETGESMSREQIRDEAITMLLAGHETTANALTWTFYLLSKHPEVRQKVEREIDQVFAKGDISWSERIKDLSYTEQTFMEAMRLYPPVWSFGRVAKEDTTIGPFPIKKGSYAFFSAYSLQRSSKYWDCPEEFRPERFSPEAIEKRKEKVDPRFVYFPFSIGQRKCIGEHFAKIEAVVILSLLIKKYRLELAQEEEVEIETSITLRPKHGIKMKIVER